MEQNFYYKKNNELLTKITVDYKKETVKIKNYTSNNIDKAFGINDNPSFHDFELFLEERCFPRNRDHMKLHLKELNLDYYDPYLIIQKTKGRLEGDPYSLEIEDISEKDKSEENYEIEL